MLRSRVFLGGQAVSMLIDGLAILAVPLLVLQLTGSPVAAVLASLPASAGYLAAGLPAGVLVDRVDPWLVLISGDVIRAPASAPARLAHPARPAPRRPAWPARLRCDRRHELLAGTMRRLELRRVHIDAKLLHLAVGVSAPWAWIGELRYSVRPHAHAEPRGAGRALVHG
jgi:hypothetical protein